MAQDLHPASGHRSSCSPLTGAIMFNAHCCSERVSCLKGDSKNQFQAATNSTMQG